MTPTAVGLVLVEGHGADGDIMDQVAFDVPTRRGATAISTSEYVAGAMARTRELANGHRPHAIGVTFSDDFELEASMLLMSLTDAGFDNIVAVRSPEASEALARGIGRTVGYQQIAVCLLEPGSVVVSMVDTRDDAVQSVAHHQHGSAQDLIGWLTDVFDANDWHPQCLIVVGPDADLSRLAKHLEHALRIPVFALAEAELALARGAALASAHGPEFAGHQAGKRRWPLPYTAALTMLVVGVLTFVVSVSFVAGLKLTSDTKPGTAPAREPAAQPATPPVVAQVMPPVAPPPPEAVPMLPPEPSVIPTVEEPPAPAQEVSAAEPEQAPEAGPPPEVAPAPALPDVAPPPAAPPQGPIITGSKPPLLTRILGHIPGLHQDPQPPAPDAGTPPP